MNYSDEAWIEFFGRLHPLLLHAPIGMLFGLVALETWGKLRERASVSVSQRRFFSALLFLGAGAAAAAGWQLGIENGYSAGDFVWHRGFGIGFTVATGFAALGALGGWSGLYRFAMFVAVASVGVAGHFGASMTHGSDYLTEPFEAREVLLPVEEAAPVQATPQVEVDDGAEIEAEPPQPAALIAVAHETWYDARIGPILEAYCVKCHGAEKQKGDLALHTGEIVVAGSEFGLVVVPGDPAGSSLLERMRAELDSDDHMPPASKPQPSAAEVDEVERWVAAGASLEAAAPAAPTDLVAIEAPGFVQDVAPQAERVIAPAPSPAALLALREAQIHVEIIDPEHQGLWIDCRSRTATDDALFAELIVPLGANVLELSLAGTAITDASLASLSQMTQLELLDVSHTACSLEGVNSLATVASLRGLNLTGVLLGDELAGSLAQLEQLEHVSLWQTGLSPEAIEALRHARPKLEVRTGVSATVAALEVEPPVSFSKFPELDAINTECPVTGSPVDSRYRVVHQNRVVGFCCPNCPGTFLKEPDKYPVAE